MAGRRWSTTRKFAGNLLPLVFSVPLLVLAASEAAEHGPTGKLFLLLGAFAVIGWFTTGLFGAIGNDYLKDGVGEALHHDRGFDNTEKYFVGFAPPNTKGLFDPHDDVGYLILHPDRLEFFGEANHVSLMREHAKVVRKRPNIHSLLGLGGWVSVEGHRDGKPIRLQIEPRPNSIQFLNALARKQLKKRLLEWLTMSPEPNSEPETVSESSAD
ncbi:MAG: hypothetical protein KF812_03625 [Fimbriimonadaceae bacterium]|nr:hypothetical protein [Fimbriimonadaceae bacterium]